MGKLKSKISLMTNGKDFLENISSFILRWFFSFIKLFVPLKEKQILFVSFSGLRFDDSPKALYEEICKRHFFDDYSLIWAFGEPEKYDIPRGDIIKYGKWKYWITLLESRIWVENGGFDWGLELNFKRNIGIHTWHGTCVKYGQGFEKQNPVLKTYRSTIKTDTRSIRCIQTESELETNIKYFHASPETYLRCGLPRNDELKKYTSNRIKTIRNKIGIPREKKIILYAPTYREYLVDENNKISISPPMDLTKWKQLLGKDYVLLIRAHYMVTKTLNISNDGFVFNMSNYDTLNDLYSIADILISDYSSVIFDYSLTSKPIRCFGYDYEEYLDKRGLLYDFSKILPCKIMKTEDEIIDSILNINYELDCKKTRGFQQHYAEYYDGNASKKMIDELIKKIERPTIKSQAKSERK